MNVNFLFQSRDHSGKLSYRSLGIALSALSSGKLKQKYKSNFYLYTSILLQYYIYIYVYILK